MTEEIRTILDQNSDKFAELNHIVFMPINKKYEEGKQIIQECKYTLLNLICNVMYGQNFIFTVRLENYTKTITEVNLPKVPKTLSERWRKDVSVSLR